MCDLTYIYGQNTPFQKKALDNINLEVKKQSVLGIIGHTGSGKSTLVQHFNGLLKPCSGKIYINHNNTWTDIWEDKNNIYQHRFKVGLVFQYPEHQLFEETVFKDIAFGPKNMGLSQDEITRRVNWAIDIVGLSPDCLKKSPFELSGGQKRKAAIAGIISMDPDVLILDEPTAGLDPKSKNFLLNNIKLYHEKRKNSVILISHNMDDVANFCSEVILMNDSKICMSGKVDEFFSEVEELKRFKITPPVITELFDVLKQQGFDAGIKIHTYQKACEYFLDLKSKSFFKNLS